MVVIQYPYMKILEGLVSILVGVIAIMVGLILFIPILCYSLIFDRPVNFEQ